MTIAVFPAPTAVAEAPAASAGLFEASQDCVKLLTLDGDLLAMNVNGRCLMEIDDFAPLRGRSWATLWPEESRATVSASVAQARAGGVARFTADCPTAKGTWRTWDVIVSPVSDAQGDTVQLVSISQDVTEARRLQAQNDLLTQELAHRIKNVFAVVDGVIAMSAKSDPTARPFAESVRRRLRALGKALAYVAPPTSAAGEISGDCTLQGLLRVLLGPYDGDEEEARRVVIDGDDIILGPGATTGIALIANELATNALKYGALKSADGRITLSSHRNATTVELNWVEQSPPASVGLSCGQGPQGFGTTLLDNVVSRQLGGALERTWSHQGLSVRMRFPVAALSR